MSRLGNQRIERAVESVEDDIYQRKSIDQNCSKSKVVPKQPFHKSLKEVYSFKFARGRNVASRKADMRKENANYKCMLLTLLEILKIQ